MSNSNIGSLVENINNISNNISSGSGSLTKLMKDDKLYNKSEKSTSELAELIEDIKNNPKRYVNFQFLAEQTNHMKRKKIK